MYENGEGVPENHAEAVKGYRLAAEQGDASAQSNLRGMSAYGMVNESNRKLTKNF
jgi:TPR repeat protein